MESLGLLMGDVQVSTLTSGIMYELLRPARQEMVVDNDGLHGTEEQSGTKQLAVGSHPLRVEYFENGGGASLTMRYKGPDSKDAKMVIPASVLSRIAYGEVSTTVTTTTAAVTSRQYCTGVCL